jgi:hypothetical protein
VNSIAYLSQTFVLRRVKREKRERKEARHTEKGQTRTEKKSSPPPSTPGVWTNHNGFSVCGVAYIILYSHETGSIYIAKCLCTSEERFGTTHVRILLLRIDKTRPSSIASHFFKLGTRIVGIASDPVPSR